MNATNNYHYQGTRSQRPTNSAPQSAFDKTNPLADERQNDGISTGKSDNTDRLNNVLPIKDGRSRGTPPTTSDIRRPPDIHAFSASAPSSISNSETLSFSAAEGSENESENGQAKTDTDSPLPLMEDTQAQPIGTFTGQNAQKGAGHKKKAFLDSLRDFSNSEQGRPKMQHLLDAVVTKIHRAHPIDHLNDRHVKPTLREKDFIKGICQDSWRPLVSCIQRAMQNVKNKHRSEILKDVKTNFETSHDPLFQAKQKEVRIAQGIQLAISSAFVVAGAAVAIVGTGASFGLAAPVATILGGAISVAGLAVGAYVGQIVFPALWTHRKTKAEPDAENQANAIGKQIGLRRLPLCSNNIEGTIEYISRSRVHKLEETAKEISDELKHLILQWHHLRTGGTWSETPSDLVQPLRECALKAAKNNPLSDAPEWAYFQTAVLERVDTRITQLNELKHAIDAISQWVADPKDTLKNQIAQDVWAAWLLEKSTFLDNNDNKPLPIGEPIAKAMESCHILADTNHHTDKSRPETQHPSALPFTKDDIVFNPRYNMRQLIGRQLRASFSWRSTPPPVRLTQQQKAQAAHVQQNQKSAILWARVHMINARGDTPEEQKKLLAAREDYDMRCNALQSASQNGVNKTTQATLEKETDQALLSLLHERIVSRNFDHFIRAECPSLSQEISRKLKAEGDSIFMKRARDNAVAPGLGSFSETSIEGDIPALQFA